MTHWAWWSSGLALAAVPVVNWMSTRRMLGVSGRYSALVDWLRDRRTREAAASQLDDAAMLEAIRAATAEEFGESTLTAETAPGADGVRLAPQSLGSLPPRYHVLFFAAMAAGGALSAGLAGELHLTSTMGELFTHYVGQNPLAEAALLGGGGVLVGFGTRMSGGCTSGHGLCGVSRLYGGSLVATAAFFGAGIAVSLLIRVLV